jgi:hypothetical protein
MRIATAGLLLCVLSLLCGCQPAQRQVAPPPSPPSSGTTRGALTLTITDSAGKPVLAVTGSGEKYQVTAAGKAVGRLKVKEGKLKIYGPDDAQIGAVKLKDGDFSLRDATDGKLAKFAPKEGGFRLKDPNGNIVLKIKPKDGGFKVSDGGETVLAKGKRSGSTLTLSAENGTTLYTITGSLQPDAAGVLLAKSLTPLQKAALMLAPALLK